MSQATGDPSAGPKSALMGQQLASLLNMKLLPKRWPIDISFSNYANFDTQEVCGIVLNLDPDFKPRAGTRSGYTGPPPQQRYNLPTYTYQVNIKKNGELVISEQYENYSRLSITTNLSRMNVIRWNDKDDEGNPSDTYTIILGFSNEAEYFNSPRHEKLGKLRQVSLGYAEHHWLHRHHQMTYLVPDPAPANPDGRVDPDLLNLDDQAGTIPVVELCRCIRIRIHDYKNVNSSACYFDTATVNAITNSRNVTLSNITPKQYCEIHRKAILAESDRQMGELSKLKKTKGQIRARVVGLPGFQGRFALLFEVRGKQPWPVPNQSRAQLVPSKDTAFFFVSEPEKVPGQPFKELNRWQGSTFLRDKQIHMAIDNLITRNQYDNLNNLKNAKETVLIENFDLVFREDADEPILSRLRTGLEHLEHVLSTQMGTELVQSKAQIKTDYEQHLPNLFIHDSTDHSVDRTIPIDRQGLENALQDPKMQFSDLSQRDAVRNVMNGDKGRTIIEGPPATGKTTTVAKILCILRDISLKEQANINVITAHTNEAVRVTCARYMVLLKTLKNVGNPANEVVLVMSRNVLNHWRAIGKAVDPDLENAMIDSHLERMADENPGNYQSFKLGCQDIHKYGRIERMSKDEKERYQTQRTELLEKLKSTKRVFFCTLATLHLRHYLFGIRGKEEVLDGIKADYLFVDEASQATDPFFAMAVLTTNPRVIVCAGDPKQLSPFATTTEGQNAWGVSLFERLFNRTTIQRLKMQYRTQQNMYAGTNAHYDNEVSTPHNMAVRPAFADIVAVLRKISYLDGKGSRRNLTSNIHIFDVTHSKCETTETGTSKNMAELTEMRGLMLALRQGGIPWHSMMFLTAYQGQYDEIIGSSSKTPGAAMRKIDSSQGDEADIVLYSMVRRKENGLGFLTDTRRQNVGTSRAREAGFYFLDMAMINDLAAARAWKHWYNGLTNHPQNTNLVHYINGPAKWFYDGKEVSLDTIVGAPSIFQPGPTPKARSRPSSPTRSRSESTGKPQQPSRSLSPAPGPSRPRSESRSSLRETLARSRAGSTVSLQGTMPSIGATLQGPQRPTTPQPQHARKVSGQQPSSPLRPSTPQSGHARSQSGSKPMSPGQQATSPSSPLHQTDPSTLSRQMTSMSLGIQPRPDLGLLSGAVDTSGTDRNRLRMTGLQNDLPKWQKLREDALKIFNDYNNDTGKMHEPQIRKYITWCQKNHRQGDFPEYGADHNEMVSLVGPDVAVAIARYAIFSQNAQRCEALIKEITKSFGNVG